MWLQTVEISHRFIGFLLLWILVLPTTVFASEAGQHATPTSRYDLSTSNISASTRIKLSGDWCFHWQQFIAVDQVCGSGANTIPLPSKWNQLPAGQQSYPRQGFASYSSQLILPETTTPLGLYVPILYRAATFYINGSLALQVGQPGRNISEEIPRDARYFVALPQDTRVVNLVVHISSFHHIDGGMNKPLEIAPLDVLAREERIRSFSSVFLVGSSLSFALYFFFMGIGHAARKDYVYLLGALSIFTYTIRVIGIEQVWLWVNPQASALWVLRFEYYGLVLAFPVFLYYLYYLFPGVVNRLVCRIALAVGITSTVFITFTPVETFAWLRDTWVGLYVLTLLYYLYCIILAIIRKKQDAILIGGIALAVVLTTINDLFLWFNLIAGQNLINFTYLSLLLGNVSILTLRMIRAANREKELANEINQLNVGLQKKVDERTHELADKVVELDQQRELAERANSAKSKFLATASHDLRQPLHALGLFIGSLRFSQSPDENKELQSKLETTHGSLTELFDALLDISKIDADAVETNIQSVSLKHLLKKVTNDFSATANNKGITLNTYARDLHVCSDPVWLERILRNLVSNAIRYTQSGKVLVSARASKHQVFMEVLDTGVGIPEQHLDDIFEEFTQLKDEVSQGKLGLGLGLSIVKKLCDLMGHSISVRSRLGAGSRFTVQLGESINAPGIKTTVSPMQQEDNLVNKTIIIADDDEEVRHAMTMMLEKWGATVYQAADHIEVFSLMEELGNKVDALISDYRFKDEINGLDIIRQVQSRYNPDLPTLLVTAETSAEKVQRFKQAGVRVLHKPVQQAKIRMMMNFLCS